VRKAEVTDIANDMQFQNFSIPPTPYPPPSAHTHTHTHTHTQKRLEFPGDGSSVKPKQFKESA